MFQAKLIIFDLDGTLVDSVPDLTAATDGMMRELGLPERGEDAVRQWVGNGIVKLVERALSNDLNGTVPEYEMEQAMPVYKKHYHANNGKQSLPYPTVDSTLNALTEQGYCLACITNKAEAFTIPLLESLSLAKYFKLITSGDSLPEKKPHPLPLLHTMETLGFQTHETLMVGDSRSDVKAARAAGVAVAAVSYGYNHGLDIRDEQPDIVVDQMEELLALIS